MVINSLYPELQSSYRQHHSTETALLNMNSQQVTPMVLLDLSSAFDTVNHDIILERLDKDIGMRGVTLDWFRSFLSNRCQQVCANGSLSKQYHLNCGVPQGSCLGPLLFSMYTSTLFKVIERHLPKAHYHADDTQLYVSFKPDDAKAQDEAIRAMENCIEDLRNWLIEGRLLLYPKDVIFISIVDDVTKQSDVFSSVSTFQIACLVPTYYKWYYLFQTRSNAFCNNLIVSAQKSDWTPVF